MHLSVRTGEPLIEATVDVITIKKAKINTHKMQRTNEKIADLKLCVCKFIVNDALEPNSDGINNIIIIKFAQSENVFLEKKNNK